MDTIDFSRFVFAFIFVLALIGFCAMMLKRYAPMQHMLGGKQGEGRVHIIETRYLDPKRKLVLIRRDDVEHLLLLSDGRELVIESMKPPVNHV